MGQQRAAGILWPESLGGADSATSQILSRGMSPCLGSRIPGSAGGAMGNVGTWERALSFLPSFPSSWSFSHDGFHVHLIRLPKPEIFWPFPSPLSYVGVNNSVRLCLLIIFANFSLPLGFRRPIMYSLRKTYKEIRLLDLPLVLVMVIGSAWYVCWFLELNTYIISPNRVHYWVRSSKQ